LNSRQLYSTPPPPSITDKNINGLDIPISALPTSARFVVHRNQYARKWEQRRGVHSDLADQEDDDNEQPVDDESANYYYNRDNKKRAMLADYISGSSDEVHSLPSISKEELT